MALKQMELHFVKRRKAQYFAILVIVFVTFLVVLYRDGIRHLGASVYENAGPYAKKTLVGIGNLPGILKQNINDFNLKDTTTSVK